MTDIVWTIEHLERNAINDGVTVAHWRATATEGEYSSATYGAKGFSPQPDSSDFTPFSELTQEQVLGWVWRTVNKEETEKALTLDIEHKKNPITLTGLPW
jgi:hypothetical protein